MPISNGRPKNRQPRRHRLYLNTDDASGFVTTWPTRRDKNGKTVPVPALTVLPLGSTEGNIGKVRRGMRPPL